MTLYSTESPRRSLHIAAVDESSLVKLTVVKTFLKKTFLEIDAKCSRKSMIFHAVPTGGE
ncbi:unnamed protein product, partial [Nesidiocoris tenuis]